ncbi:hypothetical protein BD414DRAFT_491113 [Trametes punicea]|nr:hypothetical protein BD414DRAFT_491113 [Trametes punicea]
MESLRFFWLSLIFYSPYFATESTPRRPMDIFVPQSAPIALSRPWRPWCCGSCEGSSRLALEYEATVLCNPAGHAPCTIRVSLCCRSQDAIGRVPRSCDVFGYRTDPSYINLSGPSVSYNSHNHLPLSPHKGSHLLLPCRTPHSQVDVVT